MPEGDTIFRTARTLGRAIGGKQVTEFRTVLANLARIDDDMPITGRTVESVDARGKNLLIRLSGDLVLRTHMRMNGSWHLYRHSSRWQEPRSSMRVVIGTKDWVAVAFDVPVAEFLTESQLRRHPELSRLGPDLLDESFDEDEAVRRLRSRERLSIAEALLNQRAVAGIGNEYKSEVLYLARVNPFTRVADLGDEAIRTILRIGRSSLRDNVIDPLGPVTVVSRGLRRTTRRLNAAERRWVYGRAGRPCRECGSRIEMKKLGLDARLTFWCPRCQPGKKTADTEREGE
jgi:endonuclease-8